MIMNEFKAGFFMNPKDLLGHRLAVTQKQLTEFWFSKTLTELEKILSIKDQFLIHQIVCQQYLKYYLYEKKVAPGLGLVFQVMYKQQTSAYIYDAKIFHSETFQKYQNDLISTFMIAFRVKDQIPNDEVFQFLDYSILQPQEWILKVKESGILRIFPYIMHRFLQSKQKSFEFNPRNPVGGYYFSKEPEMNRQVVILDPKVYYYYMHSLLPKYQFSPEISVRKLFEVVVDLMYNNVLIAWYESLSEQQRYQRHFQRYFRLIPKPKNKEQFTSIENRFTEIKWQTFKIYVFKLKYLVKQTQQNYQCYQIDQKDQQQLNQPYQDLDVEDNHILKAFNKQRVSSPNYDQQYTTFFQHPLF